MIVNRILFSLALVVLVISVANAQESNYAPLNFDGGWLFHRGAALGAEALRYDDADWRKLDVPHDWSQDNIPGTDSPYSATAESQVNGGFTAGGTGWYRKHFKLTPSQRDKQIYILFEGVYRNAQVWLNGEKVGTNAYGYTSFRFDLTPHLEQEGDNILTVKCSNLGENSRWYSGSGIYRHIWLEVNNKNHLTPWGSRC